MKKSPAAQSVANFPVLCLLWFTVLRAHHCIVSTECPTSPVWQQLAEVGLSRCNLFKDPAQQTAPEDLHTGANLLLEVKQSRGSVADHTLRLDRSASGALPPKTLSPRAAPARIAARLPA